MNYLRFGMEALCYGYAFRPTFPVAYETHREMTFADYEEEWCLAVESMQCQVGAVILPAFQRIAEGAAALARSMAPIDWGNVP